VVRLINTVGVKRLVYVIPCWIRLFLLRFKLKRIYLVIFPETGSTVYIQIPKTFKFGTMVLFTFPRYNKTEIFILFMPYLRIPLNHKQKLEQMTICSFGAATPPQYRYKFITEIPRKANSYNGISS